jgi:SAP domain
MPKTTVHTGASDEHADGNVVEPTPATGAERADNRELYEAETVADLKAELDSRDLPTSGNKAELVDRLLEADTTSEAG